MNAVIEVMLWITIGMAVVTAALLVTSILISSHPDVPGMDNDDD